MEAATETKHKSHISRSKAKSSHKKSGKKRHHYSSSSSSDSDSSDNEKHRHKRKRKLEESDSSRHKKKKKKKKRKTKREHSLNEDKSQANEKSKSSDEEDLIGPSLNTMFTSNMKPMTKEEWELKQSVIKRVYDSETGRLRLIKGDGEVLEEIVNYKQHQEINKKATAADGAHFRSTIGLDKT